MYNWHDCELQGRRLEHSSDCKPYRAGQPVLSRTEISRMFNEAFNKLYKKKYDLSVVYIDNIRKAAEEDGPFSQAVYQASRRLSTLSVSRLLVARLALSSSPCTTLTT